METVILVAHGQRQEGVHSQPNVKIITKAYEPLTFDAAKAYMAGGAAPEYPSTSVGGMTPLSNADCAALFGTTPGAGPGYVDTGKRRGGDMRGYRIFALRGQNATLDDVSAWAGDNYKVILLSCRS